VVSTCGQDDIQLSPQERAIVPSGRCRSIAATARPRSKATDRERVEHLFALYEKLTAPLFPAAGKNKRAKKSVGERE
jgi:hypothetical protein